MMPCASPRILPTGERECRACGSTWKAGDPSPICSAKRRPPSRTSVIAERELARIREILGITK